MITLSSLREWVHDLIYGRKIPKRFKYMTVDITKTITPISPPIPLKVQPSIRMFNGERIIVLPFNDPAKLLEFVETNRDMVYRYILSRFQQATKNNKTSIMLFQFGSSKKFAQITSDKRETQLSKMLEFFVSKEDYDSAIQCRDLIRGLS